MNLLAKTLKKTLTPQLEKDLEILRHGLEEEGNKYLMEEVIKIQMAIKEINNLLN